MSQTARFAGANSGVGPNPADAVGAPNGVIAQFTNGASNLTQFGFTLPAGERIVGIEVRVVSVATSSSGGGELE